MRSTEPFLWRDRDRRWVGSNADPDIEEKFVISSAFVQHSLCMPFEDHDPTSRGPVAER